MRAVLLAMLLLAGAAHAGGWTDNTWVVATVRSYHSERDGYNERNYGLGIEHELTERTRFVAGQYRNSLFRNSIYSGLTYCAVPFAYGCAAVMTGFVSGYSKDERVFYPAVLPILAIERGGYGGNLMVLKTHDAGWVLGLQLKAKLP